MSKNYNKEIFSQRLREIKEENNLTNKDLAEILSLNESTISRYESGKMEAKRTTIHVLANHFGLNPLWLMGFANAEKYLEKKTEKKEGVILTEQEEELLKLFREADDTGKGMAMGILMARKQDDCFIKKNA